MTRALVTGGAGLVGSSLCERLLDRGAEVLCVDNLVLGTMRHLERCASRPGFSFERWDVSRRDWHKPLRGRRFDLVVHLAANSDISLGSRAPEMDCERTFATTFETLLAARDLGARDFIFSSTSAVYGANPPMPTPESAGNLHPISLYGAGKLGSEAFISAFVENFRLRAWIFRFGNVVGARLTHGVIHDFTRRLRENPVHLAVLGNGRQTKTYIDVDDCVDGMLHGYEKSPATDGHEGGFQLFNLSTAGTTSVREIADETVKVVAGGRARIEYGRDPVGWVGDVPRTSLAVDRMAGLGWKPRHDSTAAVFLSIRTHYEWTTKPAAPQRRE